MKLDFIKQIMSEFDQSNVTKMKVEIDDLQCVCGEWRLYRYDSVVKRTISFGI